MSELFWWYISLNLLSFLDFACVMVAYKWAPHWLFITMFVFFCLSGIEYAKRIKSIQPKEETKE